MNQIQVQENVIASLVGTIGFYGHLIDVLESKHVMAEDRVVAALEQKVADRDLYSLAVECQDWNEADKYDLQAKASAVAYEAAADRRDALKARLQTANDRKAELEEIARSAANHLETLRNEAVERGDINLPFAGLATYKKWCCRPATSPTPAK